MQEKTQYIGCGKVKKVMVIKTSEEVKQARIRERQQQRYLAAQKTLLQAVEQAVTLPDPTPPIHNEQCEQIVEDTTTQEIADTKAKRTGIGQSIIETMKGAQGTMASFFNRMYTAVMEED